MAHLGLSGGLLRPRGLKVGGRPDPGTVCAPTRQRPALRGALEIDLRYVLRLRADGGVLVVEYTGYGEPIALKPPTGKIVEMDAATLAKL